MWNPSNYFYMSVLRLANLDFGGSQQSCGTSENSDGKVCTSKFDWFYENEVHPTSRCSQSKYPIFHPVEELTAWTAAFHNALPYGEKYLEAQPVRCDRPEPTYAPMINTPKIWSVMTCDWKPLIDDIEWYWFMFHEIAVNSPKTHHHQNHFRHANLSRIDVPSIKCLLACCFPLDFFPGLRLMFHKSRESCEHQQFSWC